MIMHPINLEVTKQLDKREVLIPWINVVTRSISKKKISTSNLYFKLFTQMECWKVPELCLSFWFRRITGMKAEGNLTNFYIIFNLQLDEAAWTRYSITSSFPVSQFLLLPASIKGHTFSCTFRWSSIFLLYLLSIYKTNSKKPYIIIMNHLILLNMAILMILNHFNATFICNDFLYLRLWICFIL